MFSRVGRLTTFGAHAITNCPFRREKTYQQPQKVTGVVNDQFVNFAHSFSDSIRPRTLSIGDDPFIGVTTDEEREVIKELELLDLDSWSKHDKRKPAVPSDNLNLECFDAWNAVNPDGKNIITVCGRDPRQPIQSNCFELEGWNATSSWNSEEPTAVPMVHGKTKEVAHTASHSTNSNEMMNDFANFGDNMPSFFHSPPRPESPILSLNLGEAHGHAETAHQAYDFDQHFFQPAQITHKPKLEIALDNASKMVDWDAWNKYLESDDEMSGPSDLMQQRTLSQEFSSEFSTAPSSIPSMELDIDIKPVMPFVDTSSKSVIPHRMLNDDNLFQSGPLIYIPKQEPVDEDEFFEYQERSVRPRRNARRHDSEHSWTPESDEFLIDEKPKFKKRGVVLKPHIDDETDRRRTLNRIAAVRYREKKRLEKQIRKREYQEVLAKNRTLQNKEKQLKRDINELKKKLTKLGIVRS